MSGIQRFAANFFEIVDISDAQVDAIEQQYLPLTDELRRLVDLAIRSEVTAEETDRALTHLRAAADLLESRVRPGPAGVAHNHTGRSWQWGNAVVGQRNAIAPPMKIVHHADGSTSAELHLGPAYEGPPTMVHGGVSALLLDHLMGVTASGMKKLTMTGTLTLRYRRPLPLGDIALTGRVASDSGRKVVVEATISGSSGVAVEAEGIFIVPSWSDVPDE